MTRIERLLRRGAHSPTSLVLESEVGPPRLGKVFNGQPPERYPKIWTVKRVNEGVYSGVEPAQPRQI